MFDEVDMLPQKRCTKSQTSLFFFFFWFYPRSWLLGSSNAMCWCVCVGSGEAVRYTTRGHLTLNSVLASQFIFCAVFTKNLKMEYILLAYLRQTKFTMWVPHDRGTICGSAG
jgi:hypothetical protein